MRKLLALLLLFPGLAHAAITYVGAGTASNADAGGVVTPSVHASTTTGDLVVCTVGQKNGTDYTILTSTGYTMLYGRNGASGRSALAVIGKIATGSDTVSVDSSDNSAGRTVIGQCATFRGTLNTVTGIVDASAGTDNTTQANIDTPALDVTVANSVVLIAGLRENQFAAEDIAVLSGMDAEIGQPERTASAAVAMVWDYDIQTTASDKSASAFVTTTNTAEAVSVALNLKAAAGAAPTFTSAPAIGTRTSSTIPVTATSDTTGTLYGARLTDASGTPTCDQLEAQTATGGVQYANTAVTATVQATLTFSSITSGTVTDGYFCVEDGSGNDSAVAAIADMYKKAAFSVAASVTAQSDTSYTTITKTLDGAGSCVAVACAKDATAPTVTQTLAGQCTGDAAAIATVTDASCEAGTMTLGSGLTRPVHDIYVAGTYGSQPSDLTTLADEMLDAPTGYQYDLLTSVSATSPCADLNVTITPDIAAADVTKWPTTTSPSGYAFTAGTDCETQYTDPSGTRQTATIDVYDTSAGDWMSGGPTTVYYNNTPPGCLLAGCVYDVQDLVNGLSMGSVEMASWFEDTDPSDVITITTSSTGTGTGADKIPAGTSIDGSAVWSGTAACAAGNTSGSFTVTATDQAGDATPIAVTWACNDQVAVPDCAGIDVASCDTLAGAVNLSISATFECSDIIAANGVISQGTAASTQVDPFTSFTVLASSGACTGIPPWTTAFLDDVTAVPAGSVYIGGAAYSQAGAHYVAAFPGSGGTFSISGLRYRSDGALVISVGGTIRTYTRGIAQTNLGETVAALCSPDYVVAGVPMDPDGTVCMTDVN